MKKAISVLFAFLLIVNYSCEEKIDFEKEKKAIMAVIEEETASYYASDFERWCATQIQDSTSTRINASKYGFGFNPGWDSISSNLKPIIVNKKDTLKEVKTPISIKIYEESAWVVFDNEVFNKKGESDGNDMVTNFLEKHDGIWKMVYRNTISVTSYYESDQFLIFLINYAKSLGKKVEDVASFQANQFKRFWDNTSGYNGLMNGILGDWRSMVPEGELKILEKDDNHVVFTANKMLTGLKRGGLQFNVTYDDYLTFFRVILEKYSDYMGGIYKQETTPDGVKVTLSKK
jgi:hypothetical protein